ncbi:cysteine-rich receptor-like protein kinase 8 [Prosopis cineraria]|uniref:cysteine-rich receptor-like protein kinase 8 n=1 Tax=Prosopis cineraria TaxID=364024 RepID=UPI00240F3087|nr:cysteine-rich receptor-like protein kinase 8 [Prosopis cineraria]
MTMSFTSLALPPLSFLSRLIVLTVAVLLPEQGLLQFEYYNCYYERGNYTSASAYHTNLDALLRNFASSTKIDYGFYSSSQGQTPDRVYALGLCRGDVEPSPCRRCLRNATILLPTKCPNQKQAFGNNNGCMLFADGGSSKVYVEDVNYFNETMNCLLQNRTRKGDSHRKFAASIAQGLYRTPIYGLVQCTPDLSEYEQFLFYDQAVANSLQLQPSPSPSAPGQRRGSRSQTIVMIIVPIIGLVTLFCLLGYYLLKRKSRKSSQVVPRENFGEENSSLTALQLSLNTIEAATNNLSEQNRIGKGGFGEVYKV